MKRFSFRLESVLNYRKNLQKQAQRDLYQARNEYMAVEISITRMIDTRKQIARACNEKERQGIDVPSYQVYRSFLHKIDDDLSMAYNELEQIGEKIKAKRVALKAAAVKKKTLETLKESQQKNYLEHIKKEDRKALDELTIIRRGQTA